MTERELLVDTVSVRERFLDGISVRGSTSWEDYIGILDISSECRDDREESEEGVEGGHAGKSTGGEAYFNTGWDFMRAGGNCFSCSA